MIHITKEVLAETSTREQPPLGYRVEEQELIDEDFIDQIEEELKSTDQPDDRQQTRRDGQETVH